MAKPSGNSSRQVKPQAPAPKKARELTVPSENIEALREFLGVDVTQDTDEVRALILQRTMSISHSPYSSPAMLDEYVKRGFPEMPAKIVDATDGQTKHRQDLERLVTERTQRRQDRAQLGSQIIGIIGVVLSLLAGWYNVPASICVTGIIVSIGGPNAATVIGRLMDHFNKSTSG
jgi:hypothetical protein